VGKDVCVQYQGWIINIGNVDEKTLTLLCDEQPASPTRSETEKKYAQAHYLEKCKKLTADKAVAVDVASHFTANFDFKAKA
jgi:hypothetical protein